MAPTCTCTPVRIQSTGGGGPVHFIMTIAAEKEAIRKTARAARARFAHDLPDFAERMAHFIDATRIPPKSIVGAYVALANEADPRLLVETLAARGCEIAYPRVHMKGQPLAFHKIGRASCRGRV